MQKEQTISLIKETSVGFLATTDGDGHPRVRPMAMGTIYDDNIYFATFRHSDKVNELAKCPHVEAVFATNNGQLRITGVAQMDDDSSIQERFLQDNPQVAQKFSGDNREHFMLYCLTPSQVRFMGNTEMRYSLVDWA